MGALVDAERDGQPTANADGDDLNPPALDDEDGVVIPLLLRGKSVTINVTASVPGALDAWIDYNADGSWAQAGDQIAAALPLVAGANPITFVVPATATLGQTYARFRFSTAGGLQPSGPAPNGEVEDYAVFIEEPPPESDLGDAPDSTNNFGVVMTAYPATATVANYPTVYLDPTGLPPYGPIHLQPQAVAWLGQGVTLENEADIGLDQDPTNNIIPPTDTPNQDLADDGVLNMPLILPHCLLTTFQYQINVANPAVGLYVNVWFDWNRDGDWDDTMTCGSNNAPEWAVQNQFFAAGTLVAGINQRTTPSFRPWHPTGAQQPTSKIWMRITLSEQPWVGSGSGGSGPQAGYYFGETEDYNFVPITECVISTAPFYTVWTGAGGKPWSRPDCWCYRRNCRGDFDGLQQLGMFWVYTNDLIGLRDAYTKTDAQLTGNRICADFVRDKQLGLYRVYTNDLVRLRAYYSKGPPLVPVCPMDWEGDGDDDYNFWTN